MIRATVKVFEDFPRVTEQVERAAVHGLEAAVEVAAAVAQENASIDLELELVRPHGDVEGYSAGIKSKAKGRADGAPIARFFDKGTLGKHKGQLKRPRRPSWTAHSRNGTPYTAHRGDVAGKGIEAEGFFGKARAAGRRALKARINEELGR